MAQVDYFLKIDGIPGESVDDKHKGEIDVESFSWGVTQTGTMAHGGGGGEGKANFNDFNFTHHIDMASPVLFAKCASGEHIKQAVLIGETSDFEGGSHQFLKYTFSDILVSSFQEAGAADGVMDASALRFANVKTEATPGTRIDVVPQSIGNLMLDPKTGQVIVTDSPSGLLMSGPSLGREGGGGFTRGVVEYGLTDVAGIINGPSPSTLLLTVREVRQPSDVTGGEPPEDVDETRRTPPGPAKKLFRHDLYWYPADLELTAEDFSRKGRRLGSIQADPNAAPGESTFDCSELVQWAASQASPNIGFRIQSAMDHTTLMEEEGNTPPEAESGPPFVIDPAMFMLDLSLEMN